MLLDLMDDSDHEPPGDGGPREAAHFIAGSVRDLTRVARRHDLGMLSYLLDMVLMEAEDEMKRRAGR
ncbi:MAG: hypothetical protein Q7T73_02335 [Beijerinckiaceae bacterium]|nr:hypothetical protein [Beijerinckiaceae bacterium]